MVTYILIILLVILIMYNLSKTKEGLSNKKNSSYKDDYKEMKQKLDHLKQGAKQNETAIKELIEKIKGKGNEAIKAADQVPSASWPPDDDDHHD
jgi:predicted Holliday junction resolvase-like endonuclease